MTQEEKIKEAKRLYESANADQRYVLKSLFPELAQSEDEKMMNQLHSWMKEFGGAEEYTEKVYQWIKGLLEKQGEQKPANNKGMNIDEDSMTPFQKKVFCIIDTAIEEEQGLKQVCDELLALASNEIEQKPAWSEEVGISIPNIDDTLKEEGLDPDSKEAKVFKESYYLALEKLKAQKGEEL